MADPFDSPGVSPPLRPQADPVHTTDICSLVPSPAPSPGPSTPPTLETILNVLKTRFLSDLPYTYVSPRALISVNPNKQLPLNAEHALNAYATDWRDCGEERRGRVESEGGTGLGTSPHVWQLAGRAYYYMRRTGGDASVVLSGETGSGKSENRRLAVKHLVDLSSPLPGKKGSKLTQQIPAAEYILESFGNAATNSNANASRFGQYTELQFGDTGRLCGLKTLEYYLERSRVTHRPAGERNFHIFSYLAAGGSPEERAHLHLDEVPSASGGITGALGRAGAGGQQSFHYLAQPRNLPPGMRASDARRFTHLKQAFKALAFPKRAVAGTCQVLAAILHLGNLDFAIDKSKNAEAASVSNPATLEVIASFLGVDAEALEQSLTFQTRMVAGEKCTVFLDPEGAAAARDELARSLYGLLFSWMNEFINQKLCRDDFTTFIALVDLPGPQNQTGRGDGNGLDAFCMNLASERTAAFISNEIFVKNKVEYATEELSSSFPGLETAYYDNAEMMRILTGMPGGLVHIVDDQSRRKGRTDKTMIEAMGRRWGNHGSFTWRESDERVDRPGVFTCSHWAGNVTYSSEGFLEANREGASPDFVNLLGGQKSASGQVHGGSSSSFVKGLFASATLAVTAHPKSETTIVATQQLQRPMRAPSTRRKARNDEKDDDEAKKDLSTNSVVADFDASLVTLFETLADTKTWFVFCVRPNDQQQSNQFDSKVVRHQIRALNVPEMAKRLAGEWLVSLEHKDWWDRYSSISRLSEEHERLAPMMWADKVAEVRAIFGWDESDLKMGKFKVFIGDAAFRQLEDYLRAADPEEQRRYQEKAAVQGMPHPESAGDPFAAPPTPSGFYENQYADSTEANLPLVQHAGRGGTGDYFDEDRKTLYADTEAGFGTPFQEVDSRSMAGTERYASSRNLFDAATSRGPSEKDALAAAELQSTIHEEVAEEVSGDSSLRKKWLALVWMLTFMVPNFLLRALGRMKRPDVRMAWREKLAINMMIWFVCGVAVFIIAIMGNLICPREYVYSDAELNSHSYTADVNNMLVAIRGEVFDLTTFAPLHYPNIVPTRSVQKYGGTDATALFPVQVSALCAGDGNGISDYITLSSTNNSEANAHYHDFRASTTDPRPDWYYEQMIYLRYKYRRGFMGFTPSTIKNNANQKQMIMAVLDGGVYDLSDYIRVGPDVLTPPGTAPPQGINTQFMDQNIIQLFQTGAGTDISKQFEALNIDPNIKAAQRTCLRNLFFVGKVDHRQSAQCKFSQYILLAFSIVMVSIIGFKFLAALQFSKARQPEDHEKFVVIQIPCYTEGEESLRRAIDSVTQLKYDDKRKLLFIVCDGMIIGSGNDRPTPRIVLDILGADPNSDTESLSFLSLGEGAKQHNMGKVYSGLYESGGHVVPYVVVAKCGKPTERSRPGNRGKRDSQMLLMRFFNRVHFDSAMSPLELEMYHQIKNVIGVNPAFYEYCLMIDADTTVDKFSLNRMISAMMHDQRIIGLCGETSLANARHSWTTMMQVYEYFISHHLAKAFETLFGSVTCLPGCFTLYRLRTSEHKPLLISNQVIQAYSVNRVDTLHMKNLLHLGEDRYLTTVLLKTFPNFKTTFIQDAYAKTIAPDEWRILLSQRRRWINSTIHNLAELLMIERLCGFCCFSMRFIVFIDLFSTLIQPVTVAYIAYLIYLVASGHGTIPITSIIMLASIYGLQALIFIFHRKFEHVGWMIVYILAIPIFSFLIPIYSFWRMDDFSWGNTRIVLGEKGRKLVVHDEGKFDPSSIPLKTWLEYENELWEQGSNKSIGSIIASKQDAAAHEASLYGHETAYDPPVLPHSRGQSPALFDPYGGGDARSVMSGYLGAPPGSVLGMPQGSFIGGGPGSIMGMPPGSMMGVPPPSMLGTNQYMSAGPYTPSGFFNADLHSRAASVHSFGGAGNGSMRNSPLSAGHARNLTDSPAGMLGAGSFMDPSMLMGNGERSGGVPANEQMVADVRSVLATSDLNTITKKGVRQQLEQMYGTPLSADQKAFVNQTIEDQLNV